MLVLLLSLYNWVRRLFIKREELPYIHMQSGAKFVHQWPLADDVCIEDVAHNLSKICRYAGSVEGDDVIYSVAEHCVRASYINAEEFPKEKLLHDRSETWVVDVPRPLKYSPFMWVYKYYERLAEKVSGITFALDMSARAEQEVKRVDKIMLVTEKRDLFDQDCVMCLNKMDDAEGVKPLPEKIVPWSPEQAKRAFLMRYYELTGCTEFYRNKMTWEDRMYMYMQLWRSCPRNGIIIKNLQVPSQP